MSKNYFSIPNNYKITQKDFLISTTWSPYKNCAQRYAERRFNAQDEELRQPVIDLNTYKNDTNHYIGSQGHICNNFGHKGFCVGSGLLFVLGEESNKQFVLTCAHTFYESDSVQESYSEATSSSFLFRKTLNQKNELEFDAETELEGLHVFPSYLEKVKLDDWFNDFALAVCKSNLKDHVIRKNICIADVNKAQKGDRISVVGYPHEHHGKLHFMEGTIDEIKYKNEDDSAVIIYKNIDTSEGQSGSPVYWKPKDGPWAVIGVHVAGLPGGNVAVGITKSKLAWLMETAYSYD